MTPDLTRASWFKSTRSGNNGACVEVAFISGAVAARDSKDPAGPTLVVSTNAWTRFVRSVTG
ncbi:MAG: DUF397 domain-containing protein [Actinocatenispora sp.]